MAANDQGKALELNEADKKTIQESVDAIRRVMRSKNRDVTRIIGLVTTSDIANTKNAVEVRFAEETSINVQMNMIAFD